MDCGASHRAQPGEETDGKGGGSGRGAPQLGHHGGVGGSGEQCGRQRGCRQSSGWQGWWRGPRPGRRHWRRCVRDRGDSCHDDSGCSSCRGVRLGCDSCHAWSLPACRQPQLAAARVERSSVGVGSFSAVHAVGTAAPGRRSRLIPRCSAATLWAPADTSSATLRGIPRCAAATLRASAGADAAALRGPREPPQECQAQSVTALRPSLWLEVKLANLTLHECYCRGPFTLSMPRIAVAVPEVPHSGYIPIRVPRTPRGGVPRHGWYRVPPPHGYRAPPPAWGPTRSVHATYTDVAVCGVGRVFIVIQVERRYTEELATASYTAVLPVRASTLRFVS